LVPGRLSLTFRRRGAVSRSLHRAALALFSAICPAAPLTSQIQTASLPVLTTAHAAHSLSAEEAARGYPVHLHAVVTYFDADIDPRRLTLFAHDSTGCIYVALLPHKSPDLKPGDLVDITGRTAPGDFARVVEDGEARIVGHAPLPAYAPRLSMTELLTGVYDGQWAEISGVVRSALDTGKNMMLEIAMSDGFITAATIKDPNVDYQALVDAEVLVRGNTGPLFNRRGQVTGAHLLFPGMSTLRVVRPAQPHPFEMPIKSIGRLLTFSPKSTFGHREHVRGSVTLFWPGRLLCVQDGSGGLCAETLQTTPLRLGDLVDIVGFPTNGSFAPSMARAIYQRVRPGHPPPPQAITAAEAVHGEYDSELVDIEGTLLDEDRAATDPTIVISSGKFMFPATFTGLPGGKLPGWEPGSTLRLTGICRVQSDTGVRSPGDGFAVGKSFRILARSSGDVVVLRRPTWWNARHTMRVLALALAVTCCILGWVVYLRVRLTEKTRLLQFQASHDALTGLWNRKAVCDMLEREYEIAARSGDRVGVMMLDADHFKRINDTHGHLAGDAVLKELAARIRSAIRSTDLTGRYGGEEFLVVLPGCTPEVIHTCAERVRAAVADTHIAAGDVDLAVTVSIGTAILDPRANTPRDALSAADGALYEAKHSGRNRVVTCESLRIMA
jgi:diguanylate cyclase (GGDEF)-like protein